MANAQRLDVLVIAAHPDDAELCAGGTMIKLVRQGYHVGVVDLTRGELGSRGTPEIRAKEAADASRILGISVRENLGIPDGAITNTPEHRLRLIRLIRQYRPHIVLTNPMECRHPDHGNAAALSVDACFYAGLQKIESESGGELQRPWRPQHMLHYMQSIPFDPTLVVDVSETWEDRMKALLSFRSQFHQPSGGANEDEPQTFISNPDFLEWVTAQARTYGHRIGAKYGEPFLYRHSPFGVDDLVATFAHKKPFV